MSRGNGPAINLPGSPGAAGYWNHDLSPAALLGLSPAKQSKAAGQALPPTSVTGGDNAYVPWHPDSPTFWLLAIGVGTIFGLLGASIQVRAGKGKAGANIGTT
jgi:hypothetical protein